MTSTAHLPPDVAKHVNGQEPKPRRRMKVTWAADVQPKRLDFHEDGRIPKEKLTVLAGEPGLGKSQYTILVAANVTKKGGRVLMLNAEDGWDDTLRPRLAAAGADLSLVGFAEMNDGHSSDGMRLPEDGPELRAEVMEKGIELVVVDPVMAHLGGGINAFKDQDIRKALAPLFMLGEEAGVTTIVVAHLKKGDEESILNRIGGSVGLPGMARSVLFFGRDPDDPDGGGGDQRVLAHVKVNGGRLRPTQVYRVQDGRDGEVETSSLVYVGESTRSAHESLGGDEAGKTDTAAEFLRKVLANGPVLTKQVEADARAAGIAGRTLTRARERVGAKSERGPDGFWAIRLPSPTSASL